MTAHRSALDAALAALARFVPPAAAPPPAAPTGAALAPYIDHTLLAAAADAGAVRTLCAEAARHGFASVCVNPGWVPLAARELGGSGVAVCTVVGFPLGATDTQTKAFETRQAVAHGATEIDMVLAVGRAKSGDWAAVHADMAAVVEAAHGHPVKVILETCLLTDEEKAIACELAVEAGARFVKTSTGFAASGATPHDVALMKHVVGARAEVKASGGIRDAATARAMIALGASRLGASASVAIVSEQAAESSGY